MKKPNFQCYLSAHRPRTSGLKRGLLSNNRKSLTNEFISHRHNRMLMRTPRLSVSHSLLSLLFLAHLS
jgi:hypothetical protein